MMTDDKNLPPMTSDLPAPGGDPADTSLLPPQTSDASAPPFTLTPDQISALGLGNVAPGQTYNLTLKCTDTTDEGTTFDVESAEPAESGDADLGEESPAPDLGEPEPEAGPQEDTGPLGFTRRGKTPRAGLPDIKKLREV